MVRREVKAMTSDKQFFNHQDTKARKNKRPYHNAFLGVFVSSWWFKKMKANGGMPLAFIS